MDHSFLYTKKLLLVDDEPELLELVSVILKEEGFENIITASSVSEGIAAAKAEKPDLAVLDVMLPDGDGFFLMRQIRDFSDMPVIFLTARDEAADKLAGLGLGADDYIAKPFLPEELLLRVHAVLRRCYKMDAPAVKLEGCLIDFERAEVDKAGETIPLTAMEYTLLETLARIQPLADAGFPVVFHKRFLKIFPVLYKLRKEIHRHGHVAPDLRKILDAKACHAVFVPHARYLHDPGAVPVYCICLEAALYPSDSLYRLGTYTVCLSQFF